MKVERGRKWLPLEALFALVLPLFLLGYAGAQQIYHGDGATNNGAGGWTTSSAGSNQCLNCHKTGGDAPDKSSYLLTGHKNVLRKVTPGMPWANADGSPLRTSDTPVAGSLYNSGSTFDWTKGLITVGAGPTLPYPPNPLAGTTQDLFYIFGGWIDPSQLDTIWRGGFTGEQFASGNYDCARCHTTGYSFDATGPEPTWTGSKILDTDFSRIPTDFTTGTSSWYLAGIQCERCHNADNGTDNHTQSGTLFASGIPTKPLNESGTLICLQCHREESVDTTANTINPGTSPNPPSGYSYLMVSDGGYCADGVSPDYPTCIKAGKTWNYAPFFDHESGPTFLNSPHARFSGNVNQNAQNSPDLTVSLVGTYSSNFSPNPANPATNNGCTGCHDPHQSTVGAVAAPNPVKGCDTCHTSKANNALSIHPSGQGTPFPMGTSADIPGSCVVCHMSQSYHLFRISTDPNYSTFPTAAQLNDPINPQTTPNTASDGKLASAVWSDLDLACGQCHGVTGTAHSLNKQILAGYAAGMHGGTGTSFTCAGCHANVTPAHPAATGAPAQCSDCHGTTRAGVKPTIEAACLTCHGATGAAHRFTATQITPYAQAIHAGGGAPSTTCTVCHTDYPAALIDHPITTCVDCHAGTRPGVAPTSAQACNPCHGGSSGRASVKVGQPLISQSSLVKYAKVIHRNVPPVASMHVDLLRVLVNATVTVTDTSTDQNQKISLITVGWGDGTFSYILAGESVTHSYATAGTKAIVLTATSMRGLKSTARQKITVVNASVGNNGKKS